jgi:Ca2+/Na+ antiporter
MSAMPVLDQKEIGTTPERENQILALIPRWRWSYFAFVGLLLLLAFNGKWRVGRDSAAYRGLGHQLATTGHYIFRGKHSLTSYSDQQDTRYPGMPLVLAGVEKVFGRGDLPAVLVMTLMAIATLLVTFRLMKPVLPYWLAIAVTFGLGLNGRFLEHANEVMSDVPFLLGVMLSLLAFDWLEKARDLKTRAVSLCLLIVGLLLSAAMRPTFWVLAIALVCTCIWGLFKPTHAGQKPQDTKPRRFACLMTLGVLALAALMFWLVLDVRRGGIGYEGKMIGRLTDFQNKVLEQLPENAYSLFEQTLPESFFGTQLGPGFIPVGGKHWLGFSTIYSLVVIISGALLMRRNVLWGLFVLFTVLTMMLIGSVPRYFIMILPLLLAGWGLHVMWMSDRFKNPGMKELITFVGLGVVVAPNLISCANLIREQRGLARPREGLKHVGFMKAYHSGKWDGVDEVAAMIHDHVAPEQQVYGPEATVLTFMSDRMVFGLGKFLPRKDRGGKWNSILRKNKAEFAYAVFPDTTDKLYDDKDVVTGRLIHMGIIKPTRTLARAAGYKLCEYEIARSPKKAHHRRNLAAATQPKIRHKSTKHRPKKPATQSTTAPPKRKRKATTYPATAPQRARRAGTAPLK